MQTITISADYLRSRRPWKSEQQHINEYLYKQGLPFRQNELTDLQDGMQYIGKPGALLTQKQDDGSLQVLFYGEPGAPRELPRCKKRVEPAAVEWGF